MKNRFFFIIISVLFFSKLNSQDIDIQSLISTDVLFSTKSPVPLWLMARQEGRWGLKDTEQFLAIAQVSLNKNIKYWNFLIDFELDYNTEMKKCYFQHGYAKIDYRFLNLTVGRHTFNPVFDKSYCGSGSYLFGDNYRPMDRITAGISNFTKLPFLWGIVEIRGELTHGRLDDTKGNFTNIEDFFYHKNILLHEKYALVRLNLGKWKPYGGLYHSAFMGGYDRNGNEIKIDYWKTFFAKSSQKTTKADSTNAAGAHMGMYDFGIYTTHDFGNIHFYYQKPFADGSGMQFLRIDEDGFSIFKNNKDQIVGANISFLKTKWIKNLTIEWINTKYQSGEGFPDPIINGKFYTFSQIKRDIGFDKFMNSLGVPGENFTYKQVYDYVKNNFNHGHNYGGRDGYMNNGDYPSGWAFHGQIMGSPLNLTRDQLLHSNANLGNHESNYIVNDRFRAFHIGAKGEINKNLIWKTMMTFSVNYGSYYNEYPGRYTWERTENYFFDGGLNQFYSMLGIEWMPKNFSKITLKNDFAFDIGDIFNTFAVKFGVKWIM